MLLINGKWVFYKFKMSYNIEDNKMGKFETFSSLEGKYVISKLEGIILKF